MNIKQEHEMKQAELRKTKKSFTMSEQTEEPLQPISNKVLNQSPVTKVKECESPIATLRITQRRSTNMLQNRMSTEKLVR